MDAITTKRACRRCGHWYLHELFVVVASNGARQVRGRCVRCSTESENIGHDALRFLGIDPNTIPVARDYAVEFARHPCVVCGSRYTEFHHWAPRAIFGDAAENYPGDYLCTDCHVDWHRRMSGYQWQSAA